MNLCPFIVRCARRHGRSGSPRRRLPQAAPRTAVEAEAL